MQDAATGLNREQTSQSAGSSDSQSEVSPSRETVNKVEEQGPISTPESAADHPATTAAAIGVEQDQTAPQLVSRTDICQQVLSKLPLAIQTDHKMLFLLSSTLRPQSLCL